MVSIFICWSRMVNLIGDHNAFRFEVQDEPEEQCALTFGSGAEQDRIEEYLLIMVARWFKI